jgi:RHS repeat-associated protein
MTRISYANGVVATVTYNNANQITNIGDAKGASTVLALAYGRDSNAQVTTENSNSFGYNSLNQLTAGAGLGYSYDATGRLTQTVSGPTTTNYTYDNADQLSSTAVVGGATTNYSFDAAGRRISAGSATLAWDQENRLLAYGSNNSYAYNGSGIRMSKTVAGQTRAFAWDTVEGLPLLLQDGSTYYVTGPGGAPLEQVVGTTVYYYHQDQLGSTRALTDGTGATAATYTYDAYGNLVSQTGSAANPFLFAGQYRDSESGLYHLRARYYDSSTGQFISRDPKLSSTRTPYGYVADNPLNATDPSGLDPLGDLWNIGANAVSAVGNVLSGISDWAGAQYNSFAASVSVVCPPAGSFLYGLAAGYNLDVTESNNPWFMIGEAVGVILAIAPLLTGPEDPLAVAGAVKLAKLAPKAAELASKGEKAADVASYAGRSSGFRSALVRLTGENPGLAAQAHHVFPNKFGQQFLNAGIDVNRAEYGAWWQTSSHLSNAREYNALWKEFMRDNPSRESILDYGHALGDQYGFKVNF